MSKDALSAMMAVLRTSLLTYETIARRTGRTEALLGSLKEKDVIICGTTREADRLRRVLRDRRIDGVRVTHAEPTHQGVMQIIEHYHRNRRYLFDHTFIHLYLERAVDRLPSIFEDIEKLNQRLSQQDAATPAYRLEGFKV